MKVNIKGNAIYIVDDSGIQDIPPYFLSEDQGNSFSLRLSDGTEKTYTYTDQYRIAIHTNVVSVDTQ